MQRWSTITRLTSLVFLLSVSSLSFAYPGVFPQSVFKNLDYGLYWFGNNDNYEKAVPGYSNAYYSKSAPTIIYIHGWQNGSSQNQNRETFNRSDSGGPNVDLAYPWRQAGYNVRILYWNQFADEGEVKDAEAKIWSKSGLCAGVTIRATTLLAPTKTRQRYYSKALETTCLTTRGVA